MNSKKSKELEPRKIRQRRNKILENFDSELEKFYGNETGSLNSNNPKNYAIIYSNYLRNRIREIKNIKDDKEHAEECLIFRNEVAVHYEIFKDTFPKGQGCVI